MSLVAGSKRDKKKKTKKKNSWSTLIRHPPNHLHLIAGKLELTKKKLQLQPNQKGQQETFLCFYFSLHNLE